MKIKRWIRRKSPIMGDLLDLGPMLLVLLLLAAPVAGLVMWGTWSACGRICEANGAENGWDWWAGCYCKDGRGLYNPKDSRETH